MPARAFRCQHCHRTLGHLTRSHERNGQSHLVLKLGVLASGVERRLFSGRWVTCQCGKATKAPTDAKVIFPAECC